MGAQAEVDSDDDQLDDQVGTINTTNTGNGGEGRNDSGCRSSAKNVHHMNDEPDLTMENLNRNVNGSMHICKNCGQKFRREASLMNMPRSVLIQIDLNYSSPLCT